MRLMMIAGLALILGAFARPAYSGEVAPDPCKAFPQELAHVIKRDYPGREIVTIKHLPGWRQAEYEKEGIKSCPGVAKVNFFGDGRLAYVIALVNPSEEKVAQKANPGGFLLAYVDVAGVWKLKMLSKGWCSCEPIVAPAGEYKNFYGNKIIRSKGEVIVEDFGSAARLFAWTGNKIDSISIKD